MTTIQKQAAPKFFMPKAKSEEIGEQGWQSIRERHHGKDKRIFSLTWRHNGELYHAEVGKTIQHIGERVGEVITILEGTNCYMVCTVFRGVLGNDVPIYVGDNEYISHVEFAPMESSRSADTV